MGHYTADRKEQFDKVHSSDFLWPEEQKLLHHFMMENNEAFAWDDSERGRFKTEYSPPVDIPIIAHTPWVLKNIPIPPGVFSEVCKFIKTKLEAGVYSLQIVPIDQGRAVSKNHPTTQRAPMIQRGHG